MAHSIALRLMLKAVIKDKAILGQIEFYEIYNNRTTAWLPKIKFDRYSKIVLYAREGTYQTFDFDRLRNECLNRGIDLVNAKNTDQLDKFSTNQIWASNGIPVPEMHLVQHPLDTYNITDTVYPAIVSAYAGHGELGNHTLVFDRASVEHWLNVTHVNIDAIVTKFIEYRDTDGYFRKGRVIRLGGDNYLDTSIIGNRLNWHVHHTTAGSEMLGANMDLYREKVPDFDEQVKKLFETTDIEVGALDFCVVGTDVIPFEITVPYHRSYRHYEFKQKRYNKHFDQMVYSIVEYYTVLLRDLYDIEMDYCKFQYDLIDYIFRNKGITDG